MLSCICKILKVLSCVVFETSRGQDLVFPWRNGAAELSSWLGERASECFHELEMLRLF